VLGGESRVLKVRVAPRVCSHQLFRPLRRLLESLMTSIAKPRLRAELHISCAFATHWKGVQTLLADVAWMRGSLIL
jgi:hypothetical protein